MSVIRGGKWRRHVWRVRLLKLRHPIRWWQYTRRPKPDMVAESPLWSPGQPAHGASCIVMSSGGETWNLPVRVNSTAAPWLSPYPR